MTSPFLSVVVPVYNEEASVNAFWGRLSRVLSSINVLSEVVFVNDGSRDDTVKKLIDLKDSRIRIISLSKNHGHMTALDAGLRACGGSWAVSLDGDLQHPPELIETMLVTAIENGLDVVSGKLTSRNDASLLKRAVSRIYYPIIRWITGFPIEDSVGDFRLVSRRVLDVINRIPPGGHVYRVLIPSFGFPSTSIPFSPDSRFAGDSKYNLGKMMSLAINSALANSERVFRFLTSLAVAASAVALGMFVWAALAWGLGETEKGWTSLISLIVLGSLMQISLLLYLGILLQKLVKIVMGIPQYVEREEPHELQE
jgi:dolichol-phosphate mannosyltransferase